MNDTIAIFITWTTYGTWTKGGDCEILDTDDDIEAAVIYVMEAQDHKNVVDN